MSKERSVPEKAIQAQILQYLAYSDVLAQRNNAGMLRASYITKAGAVHDRMVKLGTAGWPDVIGMLGTTYGSHAGQFLGIEVKRPGNKPTEIQTMKLDQITEYGGLAFLAWSLDDVVAKLEPLRTGTSYRNFKLNQLRQEANGTS